MNKTNKPHRPRRLPTMVAAFAAVLVVGALAILPRLPQLWHDTASSEAPAIGGPFTLVDQNGKTVTDADFRGKLMVIYFGYTFCPDVCPTALGLMAQAYDQLTPAEQAQVVPIFITVDPERDTVDQMASYVAAFHPALIGLTGSPEQVQKAVKGYKVYARKAEGDGPNYTMDHSSIVYLMGRDGRLVGHFSHTASVKDIADGIRKAL